MIRGFTTDPLPAGTADRLLATASRAPSAGFSQGFSFLVLEDPEQCAPFWRLLYEQAAQAGEAAASEAAQVDALSAAPLVIVPLASKDVYLNRYAQPDKAWTAQYEDRWAVPYWYIDTGFATLLILLAVVDASLGAVFFGPPDIADFRAELACRRSGCQSAPSPSVIPTRPPIPSSPRVPATARASPNSFTAVAGSRLRAGAQAAVAGALLRP
jgi:nitroreductase